MLTASNAVKESSKCFLIAADFVATDTLGGPELGRTIMIAAIKLTGWDLTVYQRADGNTALAETIQQTATLLPADLTYTDKSSIIQACQALAYATAISAAQRSCHQATELLADISRLGLLSTLSANVDQLAQVVGYLVAALETLLWRHQNYIVHDECHLRAIYNLQSSLSAALTGPLSTHEGIWKRGELCCV